MQLDELKRRTRIIQGVCACVGATILLLVTHGTAAAESKRVMMLHSFGRDSKALERLCQKHTRRA